MGVLIAPCKPLINCRNGQTCVADIVSNVSIVPRITGGTQIFYQLNPINNFSLPLTTQLQFSRVGTANADDWTNVTDWEEDVGYLIDPTQRDSGWYQLSYYRIAVRDSTENKTVYSKSISASAGVLKPGEYRLYKHIVNRETRAMNDKAGSARLGYLLKVRYYGTRCTVCYDTETKKVFREDCPVCFGVGFNLGYYPPIPCFYAEHAPIPDGLKLNEELGAHIEGGMTSIRYLNIPNVNSWDVWVDAATDHRFIIGDIKPLVNFGPLNVVCQAAVGRLSFDHPVYSVNVIT